jgi:hypothetical protein
MDGRVVPSRFVFPCTRKQTGNPTETKFPISQNLHHLVDRLVPHSKLRCNFSDCYPSVSSDELSCSSSQSAAARLIGDVRVSVLKMFHPPSDTAGISIHTTKSLVDDSCRVSISHKKFSGSTLTKGHVGDSHFFAVHDWNVIGAHALILFFMLERDDVATGSMTVVTIFQPTQFFIILLCSFLSVRHLYIDAEGCHCDNLCLSPLKIEGVL